MNKEKILITGASGCVGQYIANWLLNNSQAELFLWLREPKKLTAIQPTHPRVKLLVGDLRNSEYFANDLRQITKLIHTATAWGDPIRAHEVNIVAVKNLLSRLDPNVIEMIIYFSTASILNNRLEPLDEAILYGTEYIQTKARCLEELNNHQLSNKIIAVFPTLVFGGSVDGKSSYPNSYLTEGLKEAVKWLWIARWLRGYSRFHFIHAADIASVCGHLVTTPNNTNKTTNDSKIKKLLLAQEVITIDQAVDVLCKWRRIKKTPRIPLFKWIVEILIKILPIKLSSWDRFSINKRHFDHHPITNPESYGIDSKGKDLFEILRISGLPNR